VTIDTAMRARLLSLSPVTTLVGTSVWAGPKWPQKPELPAILVFIASQVERMHTRGPDVFSATIQVNSRALSRAGALAVDAAVQGNGLGPNATGLKGWKGTASGIVVHAVLPALGFSEGFDPDELQQYVVRRFFNVQFEGTQ